MKQSLIRYSIPDFADNFDFNLLFLQLITKNPLLLKQGIVIDSIYGCFPNCALNGGRAFVREPYSRAMIDETFSAFAELEVTPRLTLTNMLAKEEDLHDPYVVDILEIGKNYGAEAIVFSDFVGNYIKDNYGMKIVLSTTRVIDTPEELNRMADSYDWVVLNYNHNKDKVFLDAIERPEKVEVMVNEYCVKGCPRRAEHYLHNSQDQRSNRLTSYDCRADKINTFLRHAPNDPIFFTDSEVSDLHRSTGIDRFKIVGRGIPFEIVLESYVYYLIAPDYQEDVRSVMLNSMQSAFSLGY